MGNLFIIILIVLAIGWLVWNFVPAIREKMRGLSTILEGFIATVISYFGMFTDGLKEAQAAGYIPEHIEYYVPAILFVWIMIKRFQTKTPVGHKSTGDDSRVDVSR